MARLISFEQKETNMVTAPEPLDFAHKIQQVDRISHRLQGLQGTLVDLHFSISREDAWVKDEREGILSSWSRWGNKLERCKRDEKSLTAIDHHRKESLAHLDAVDSSLRSYKLDILGITSVSSHILPQYHIFRLQSSIQRLGRQPVTLPQIGARDTVDPLVTYELGAI